VVQFTGCVVIFADDHREFATGIAQNRSAVHSLNALEEERAASAGSIREGLMLGKTVRVPRHVELSEPGWRRTGPSLTSSFSPKLVQRCWKLGKTGGTGSTNRKRLQSRFLDSYYFGHRRKCNVF